MVEMKEGKVSLTAPCKPQTVFAEPRIPPGVPAIWWDVFAIPSARPELKEDGTTTYIPGYYKMRSRFVDYPGTYVMHCHILIHEDRGMMFRVEVAELKSAKVPHH